MKNILFAGESGKIRAMQKKFNFRIWTGGGFFIRTE